MLTNDSLVANLRPVIPSLLKWSAGGVAFLLIYITASGIYNLLFHPLSSYPGPPLARVSRLWSRIGNFKGCKSERIHEAHLKYGMYLS